MVIALFAVGMMAGIVAVVWFGIRLWNLPSTEPVIAKAGMPPVTPDAASPGDEDVRPELAAALAGLEEALAEFDALSDETLDFETDIVGESFDGRQAHLDAIVSRAGGNSRQGVRFIARLVREPENPYDVNAVAVVDAATGSRLGYLSRALAGRYKDAVAGADSTDVPALVVGDRMLGVWLDLTSFNEKVGLPPPERLKASEHTYFEQRHAAACVDGVNWNTHHSHATEAAEIGDVDVAADAYEKACRGWLGALAFERRPPGAARVFEDFAKWCRKNRPGAEVAVLEMYAEQVAPLESGSSRHVRMMKRLAAVRRLTAEDAPF